MNQDWYEVWVDDSIAPPYVLIVLPKNGLTVVFDPKVNQIAHETVSYENAKLWLLEDEYRRVEGRMKPDD